MSPTETILVADDDNAIRTVLNQALVRVGYQVRSAGNLANLWRWVAEGEGDLLITDVVLPDGNVFDLLPRIKKHRPDLPIIVMSAQNTLMTAVKAAEKGAYDYLPKPFDLNELTKLVQRALSVREAAPAAVNLPDEEEKLPLIGRSPAMQEIYRVLKPEGIAVISSVMHFRIHDYPHDYWRFTPEAFKSLLKPFACSFVSYAGFESFPHTIVGIGFKNQSESIPDLSAAYLAWQKQHYRQSSMSGLRRIRKLLTPPLLSSGSRKALGL